VSNWSYLSMMKTRNQMNSRTKGAVVRAQNGNLAREVALGSALGVCSAVTIV
jgi:hypothetical protein